MKTLLSKQELIDFEEDIANCFNNKMIKAPIHLDNGNEEAMIEIFKSVNENDWCFGTWRSHYICLLKGVPKNILKQDILDGKSITLCYKDYNIFSSAIVGGSIPIALGAALDLKRQGNSNMVWCFVGDMGSMTGGFQEAFTYAVNFKLPIKFIVADNNKSVVTDTNKSWGQEMNPMYPWDDKEEYEKSSGGVYKWQNIWYYEYTSRWPHSGGSQRINF